MKSGEKVLPFEKFKDLHHHDHPEQHEQNEQQHKQPPDEAKECQDESYCHEININSELCNIDNNIYKDCYASCSGCKKCGDDATCDKFPINQVLCDNSEKIKELCKKSCNLCIGDKELPLKGMFRNPFHRSVSNNIHAYPQCSISSNILIM